MADILIRGMEYPKSCSRCDFASVVPGEVWCKRAKEIVPEEQAINVNMHPTFCPLHELPDHGDLVDVGTAYDKIAEQETSYYMDMDGVDAGLQATPVIVPASEPTKSG